MKSAQRESLVHHGRMRHKRRQATSTAAREHDGSLLAKLGKNTIEKTIHAGDLAKDHAGLHGLARGTTDGRLGCMQLDHGQAGCGAGERLRPKRKPRRDNSAEKRPLTINDLDIHGGPKVHRHDRCPIGGTRGHHV